MTVGGMGFIPERLLMMMMMMTVGGMGFIPERLLMMMMNIYLLTSFDGGYILQES